MKLKQSVAWHILFTTTKGVNKKSHWNEILSAEHIVTRDNIIIMDMRYATEKHVSTKKEMATEITEINKADQKK